MSRRGRTGSPFSLFSFQDIITCVSGIIILITLVLALELTQRKPASPREQTRSLVSQMRQTKDEALVEVEQLRQEIQASMARAQGLASVSEDVIKHETFLNEQQAESLRKELADLKAKDKELKASEDRYQARQFDRRAEVEQQAKEDADLRQLEDELGRVQQDDRLIYNPRTADGKRVWLIEVEAKRLIVGQPPGGTGPPREMSLADAAQWLKSRSPAEDFVFLLVRSGGKPSFEALLDQIKVKHISYGFDLLASDQAVARAK